MSRADKSVALHECQGRGLGIAAARTDGDQIMLRLDHIAGARDDIGAARVGDAQQGLEAPQAAVAAPVLGQFDRRTREVAEFLELALEALEQGEGIRGAAGKSGQHLAAVQAPHLARVGLHDALTEGHLAVAADRDAAVAPHRQYGGAVRCRLGSCVM